MTCVICKTRRPRRFCPGVHGNICAICCGTEREVTVNCPLDCEYLQEARRRERPPEVDPKDIPNHDVRVSEEFLNAHTDLVTFSARAVLAAAIETEGIVDFDVREALEASIRTYRTLDSGLIYETRPTNPIAARIQERLREAIDEYRKAAAQSTIPQIVRDNEILGALVFLQRVERYENNGRRKGRAFIDHLRRAFPMDAEPSAASSLLV